MRLSLLIHCSQQAHPSVTPTCLGGCNGFPYSSKFLDVPRGVLMGIRLATITPHPSFCLPPGVWMGPHL